MTNNELKIILSVQDKATKIIKNSVDSMKTKMKNFAADVKKNWLAISATIIAGFLAIKKAWEGIKLAARIEQTASAFSALATSFGVDADRMISDLKSASAQTLTTMELMEKASSAMALGLNPEKFGKLMEVARAAARVAGKDISFMFDSIVMGIGRQSKQILDNLFIIVKAEDAYQKYADANNLVASSLTEAQKKQAFFNAALDSGEDLIKRVGLAGKTQAEVIQGMEASFKEAGHQLAVYLNQLLRLPVVMEFWAKTFTKANTETKKQDPILAQLTTRLQEVTRDGNNMRETIDKGNLSMIIYGGQLMKSEEALKRNNDARIALIRQLHAQAGAEKILIEQRKIEGPAERDLTKEIEGMQGLAEAQLQSLNTMRMQWAMYQEEELANVLAMTQRETEYYQVAIEARKTADRSYWVLAGQLKDNFSDGMTKMSMSIINGTFKQREAFQAFGKVMLETLIKFLIQSQVNAAFSKLMSGTQIAQAAVTGSAVAAAWAPAAAMVSLATLGGNSAPASAALSSVTGLAQVLSVPQLAEGGVVDRPTLALIGESGPEAVVPLSKGGGGQYINIEINNPVVRSDEDIDALAEEVSTILAREAERL